MMQDTTEIERYVPSTRKLPPGTVLTQANGTTVTTVRLLPAAVSLVVALDTPANVAALTIRGAGSGAALAAYVAAPTVAYIIVQVAPAIDSEVTISLTAAAGGPVTATFAEAYEALGTKVT